MPTEKTAAASDTSQNQEPALANEGLESKTAIKPVSEREALLATLDRRIEESRVQDDETFLRSGDPRAAMLAAEMGREARGEKIQADSPREADVEQEPEDDAPAAQAAKAVRVSTKGVDPLAEYIVRDEAGKAMFRAVVDGQVHLIPVDKARAQLQKHIAADSRLQHAAERQAQLDVRERQIQATEATLKLRAAQRQAEATPIDDESLDRETNDLVRALVSRPEAEAAKQMAALMKKVRQASPPQIDIDAIVSVAVTKAKQEIAAESEQKALTVGLKQFTRDYPDIAADSELFATADRKTTAIAQEHPEWSISEVMMEAGKQTRAWLKSIGVSTPDAATTSQPSRRQEEKSKLTPMPASRIARPATAADDPNAPDDPSGYLASLRKARGENY